MDSSRYFLPEQSQASQLQPSSSQSPLGSNPTPYNLMAATYPLQDFLQSPSFSPAIFTGPEGGSPLDRIHSPRSRSSSASSSRSRRDGSASPRNQRQSPVGRRPEIRPKVDPDDSPVISTSEGLREDELPATCDFVRKLYRLLEDPALVNLLCWGPGGDFFIIKDVNAFTTDILPRTFKHSNFASFVRQLNKYDFHKIKAGDDYQFGENSWLFRHRDFRAGGLDRLENIKRKVPGTRKSTRSTPPPGPAAASALEGIQAQIQRIAQRQNEITASIQNMESEYVSVVDGMVNLQRNFAQQDETMRHLVQYALQYEDGSSLPVNA